MQLGVIGINHKLANLPLREALAQTCQKRFAFYDDAHLPHRFLLLSTCNRTEVYFVSDSLSDAQSYVLNLLRDEIRDDFDQKLYSFFGMDCFHHLCRVTAGLDSAVVAETEIQGQVKLAYQTAVTQAIVPSVMHFAFQKALKVGKTTRYKFPMNHPTLEHAILSIGSHFFKGEASPKILFVGASHINGKVIDHFKKNGWNRIAVTNRSPAHTFAQQHGIELLDWTLKHMWMDFDWIVFGTRSPQPLLLKQHIFPSSEKLLVDLSVPRNVDSEVGKMKGITLLNIDQINRTLRKAPAEIQCAEKEVLLHCKRLTDMYIAKRERQLITAV